MHVKKFAKKGPLIVNIEALHSTMTGNYTFYTEEAIDSILESWTKPYAKPFIFHHEDEVGEIVGRVIKAEKIVSKIAQDCWALLLTCRISDSKTVQGIIDGRYLTTSVGVSSTHTVCSICGQRITAKNKCSHQPGKYYKEQLCFWKVFKMQAKEISFVIIPSDKYSKVVSYYYEKTPDEVIHLTESLKNYEEGESDAMTLEEALQENNQLKLEIKEHLATITEKDALITTHTNKQTELENENTTLTQSLNEEKTLRENLEDQLHEISLKEKASIIDKILEKRSTMGLRKVEASYYENKDIVYLNENLQELEEELQFKESQASTEDTTIIDLKEQHIQNNNVQIVSDKEDTQKKKNVTQLMHNIFK